MPIIPGIMPVYTIKMTKMLSKLCGSSITPELQNRINSVDIEDKKAVLKMGIKFSTEQCKGLLGKNVPGLHFYTMDRSFSTAQILHNLKEEKILLNA